MTEARSAPFSLSMRCAPLPTGDEPSVAQGVLRPSVIDDAALLAELLGGAYEGEIWHAAGTRMEVFGDATIRATVVVECRDRLVATASLQVTEQAPECGRVRWVATHVDHRRQGLGRAVVRRVLNLAVEAGCVEARLSTERDRLPAIALYRELGFEPLIESRRSEQVWGEVLSEITQTS